MTQFTPLMLSNAGFSNNEINSWIDNQRKYLKVAGFSDFDINNAYGLTQVTSKALGPVHLSHNVTDVYEQHEPLGSKNSLLKKSEKQNDSAIHHSDKMAIKSEENLETNFQKLSNDEQKKIKELYLYAAKHFKDDQAGKAGYIDQWFSQFLPNVDVESTKFLLDTDLTTLEAGLNDQPVELPSTDFMTSGDKAKFVEAETENLLKTTAAEDLIKKQEIKEQVEILHTPASTGILSMAVLFSEKDRLKVSDLEVQQLNEAISFISAFESDNRNIINPNPDSSASGVFQLNKATMETALNSLKNTMRKYNPNWELPQELKDAEEHLDMTKLHNMDFQRALALINLISRTGTDDLLMAIMKGSVEEQKIAIKQLYIEHHHTGKISKEQEAKVDKYLETWGTPNYGYTFAQLPYLPSENIVTQAIEALPKGDRIIAAMGGKGYYSVFTNGYLMSVNGFIDSFHKITTENPDMPIEEVYNRVFMWNEQSFSRSIVQDFVTLANDLPWMAFGCIAANIATGTSTGGTSGIAAPVICGAGMFAAPDVIRSAYMDAIAAGEVDNGSAFMKHFFTMRNWFGIGKEGFGGAGSAVIGGATLGVGTKISKVVGPRLTKKLSSATWNEKLLKAQADKSAKFAKTHEWAANTGTMSARISGEIATMVTLDAWIQQNKILPDKKDFAHAAVLIFGMHGVRATTGYAKKGFSYSVRKGMDTVNAIKTIYRTYGIHPDTLVKMSLNDHTVRDQLLIGEIPDTIINASKKIIKGVEEKNDIKLLPPPKYQNNENIHISVSGLDGGKIISKQTIGNNNVLIVEKPSGEKVPIFETETRKINIDKKKIVIDKDNKIRIDEPKDTNFKKKQDAGEYNTDIVELAKDKDGVYSLDTTGKEYKATAVQTLNDLGTQRGSRIKIQSEDGKAFSDSHMLIVNKFYPKMAKAFEKIVADKWTDKYKTANDLMTRVFKGITDKHKKIDVVFAVNKGALEKIDTMVGRVGDTFVSFSRKAYLTLSRFTDKDGKVKNAKVLASEPLKGFDNISQLVFLHPETNKPIGLLMTRRIDGQVEAQAQSYWKNHKSKNDMEGIYYDKVNSTRDGNTFEPPSDAYDHTQSYSGFSEMPWQRLYHSAKGLDLHDLVSLSEIFIKKSPELKKLTSTLRGYFQFKGKNAPRVVIAENLQKAPIDLYQVLAHEIGHLIDYLPDKTLARGNILGSIKSLKRFMSDWIDGKNDGVKPLSLIEINALRKKAEKIAKALEKETNKEIKELEITPETVLKIFQDAKAREKINPLFYEAFAKLSSALKKLVVKDAMKGLMSHHLKAIADKINGKKVDPKLSEEANRIFKDLFEKEIQDRGLVSKEMIVTELKKLTMKWKPFNEASDPKYTKYRYNPRELFADFMMAWLLKPQWVKLNAPRTFEAWIYHIEKKPEVKKLYEDIQIDLNSKGSNRNQTLITKMIKESRDANVEKMKVIEGQYIRDWYDALGTEVADKAFYFFRRKGNINNRWKDGLEKQTEIDIERFRYRQSKLEVYTDTLNKYVIKPIYDLGFNLHEFGVGLALRNLRKSDQRKNVVTRGFLKLDKEIEAELRTHFKGRSIEEVWEQYAKDYPDLLPIMDKFSEIRQLMVIGELKGSGKYSADQIKLFEENFTYIKFDVLKYVLKRIEKYGENAAATSFLGKTTGTFNRFRNAFEATVETDMVLISETRRHQAMSTLVQWLLKNKLRFEAKEGLILSRTGTVDRVIMKPKHIGPNRLEKPPKGLVPFHYLKNGELQTYYINEHMAKLFMANPISSSVMVRMLSASGEMFRKVFTELNPAFWPFDLVRDSGRAIQMTKGLTWLDIHGGGKRSFVKYLVHSAKPAYKRIFKDGTPLTRWMDTEGMLIGKKEGYQGQAGQKAMRLGMDEEQFMLEQMMKTWYDGTGKVKKWNRITKKYETIEGTFEALWEEIFGSRGFFGFMSNNAKAIATMPKIAYNLYLNDAIKRGDVKMNNVGERMLRTQGDVGHPSFLRQGTHNQLWNNIWLYLNPWLQAVRSDFTRFLESPLTVSSKFVFYHLIPKLTQKAIELGVFGMPVAALMYGVNQWDRENYIVVPLGADAVGRTVYLRIPQHESARLLNATMYKLMSIKDDPALMGEPDSVAEYFAFIGRTGTPSMNPIFKLIADLLLWMNGKTPFDDFKGRMSIDQTIDKADDARRNVEIQKWFINTYTGQGFYKIPANDLIGVQTHLEQVLGFPIVGTVFGRFFKIGSHPAKISMNHYVKEWDRTQAVITLDTKEALEMILTGKAHKLEAKHYNALNIRKKTLESNTLLRELLAKMAGGDMLLQEFFAETDKKKQLAMLMGLIDFIKKTDGQVPLTFLKEKKKKKK